VAAGVIRGARHAAQALFGIDRNATAPTRPLPSVQAGVVVLVMLGITAAAGYAASIDLGLSADGAWAFARVLDDRTLVNVAWPRLYADWVMRGPLALAVNAGVTSLPVLKAVFHLGLYLPFLVSFALCWYATRPLDNDALLLFPLASYLLVSLPAASMLSSTSHVLAAIVWPILFLLLRPRLSWLDTFLLIPLLLLLSRTYEAALAAALVFLGLLGARLAVEPSARRPILVAITLVVLLVVALTAYWIMFPFNPTGRANFVEGMSRSIGRHPMLTVSVGALVLLVASLATARLRLLAVPAVLLAAAGVALPALGRTATAGTSFDLRSLPLTLLPVLLLAAIWFHHRKPHLSTTDWMVTGTILLLLSAGYAASWTAWRDMRQEFVTTLAARSGYVPVDDTSLADSPQRWRWTTSLLSILWAPDCVRTILVSQPGLGWEPFDPRTRLPLQTFVAYDLPFAAASPHAKRCS
jgi:hypothetical protein